jgi:hypothetical protein
LPPRYGLFDDDWWDEDEDNYYRSLPARGPTFRELHPHFDSGAVHPELIYPIEHGADCKGHPRPEWYIEEYLWSYERVPKIHFYGAANVVPVREEYL